MIMFPDTPAMLFWILTCVGDHPPMVAYLIRVGTFLFGDTIIGIRSMAIVAMLVADAAIIKKDYRQPIEKTRCSVVSVLCFNLTWPCLRN